MNPQVTEFINSAPEGHREIMEAVRRLIHENVSEVREEFKWSRPVFGVEKDFAYLQATKNHVTLGFYNFEKLDDPDNLLEGTGKSMRHIKLKSIENLDAAPLPDWLKTAARG